MPWVESTDAELLFKKATGVPEFEGVSPDTMDLALAEFRTGNIIGSTINRSGFDLPDKIVDKPDFNPWDLLTDGEKKDEAFMENALYADNEFELNEVRRFSRKYRKDRKTLADGGAMSFLMGFGISGVGDPINLIPIGGAAVKTYKTGGSVLKSGLVVGSTASAATALQESALHATQIERTYGESAINVTAAFLLGGALGSGIEGLKKWGVDDAALKQIDDTMNLDNTDATGKSTGAAAVADDFEIKGKVAQAMAKVMPDPLSRTVSGDNPFTRKYANFLAENPYAGEKGNQTAVESLIKIHDGKYVQALQKHDVELVALRKRLGESKITTLTRKGMTRGEFNELVSKEIRNPSSNIPEVQKAAKGWVDELYEPLKREMIDAELLPSDVDVKTAVNYLNRAWNRQKLAANADTFIAKTAKWLKEEDLRIDSKTDIDLDEYMDVARQIHLRLISSPDGRLPYDWKLGEGSKSFQINGTSLKSPMKERTFNVPDKDFEEFFENDIEVLGARYLNQTAPDIEISRAFDGDLDMQSARKDMREWWQDKIEKSKNKKEKIKFQKRMTDNDRDMVAMRDRMRGTYAIPDHDSIPIRALRVARDLNYLRFMGGVTPSSIPDIARAFMAEGFVNTMKHGLRPLVKNLKTFKVSAAEAKRYGVGTSALTSRSEVMADVADYSKGGTAFERGVRSMAQSYGKINLLDKWTSFAKQLHVVTMQTSVIDKLVKGKYDARLGRLGIDEANAKNIAGELKKHAKQIDGVWISNAKNWDSPALERIWGAALRKESDRVIVMPGQEKPLLMSREMGKTFFQFRSFMMSATQRMLIAGIQGQEANYFGGALMLTTMGMMSYSFKQWDAGREISDDPKELIIEGIDRSGMLGMLMEANNTIEKMSENGYGLRPMLGVKSPAARFVSRNKSEAFLGPTYGSLMSTSLKVLGAGTREREWSESDTRALRRLLPYQNLMLFRQAVDKMESETHKGIK